MNHLLPGPRVSHWGNFNFLQKFAEIFERLITVVNDTSDKLKKFCDRKFFPVWLRCCLHSYNDFLLDVHFEAEES
jgi:hypothetical protein